MLPENSLDDIGHLPAIDELGSQDWTTSPTTLKVCSFPQCTFWAHDHKYFRQHLKEEHWPDMEELELITATNAELARVYVEEEKHSSHLLHDLGNESRIPLEAVHERGLQNASCEDSPNQGQQAHGNGQGKVEGEDTEQPVDWGFTSLQEHFFGVDLFKRESAMGELGKDVDKDDEEEEEEESEYGTCYSGGVTVISASTGVRTDPGATWEGIRTLNNATGFAGGAPFSANYKGVREGRENKTAIYGVGRTGKGPARVPDTMIEAMRAARMKNDEDSFNAECAALEKRLDALEQKASQTVMLHDPESDTEKDYDVALRGCRELRSRLMRWKAKYEPTDQDTWGRRRNMKWRLSARLDDITARKRKAMAAAFEVSYGSMLKASMRPGARGCVKCGALVLPQ